MILVLISDFMQDEIYLKDEMKYYHDFSKIIFFSVKGHQYSNKYVQLEENGVICGERDIFYRNTFDRIKYLFYGMMNKSSLDELAYILKSKKWSRFCLKSYSLFTAKTQMLYDHMKKRLKELGISAEEKIVFYSYRLGIGTAASILLCNIYRNAKVVSRCHGQDIFEFRNNYGYLPYRKRLFSNIDVLYCISQDGYNYIKTLYPEILHKARVFRLGTTDLTRNTFLSNKPFVLVSCSRIVPIKRLHLLATALSEMTQQTIEWIHYGNGDVEYEKIICNIISKMPDNITVRFEGFVDNDRLHELYTSCHFSAFINISESEGLPVSIMEACSVGMPIIATNVGGTSEIVTKENGILLKKEVSVEEIKEAIISFYNLSSEEYSRLSDSSRKMWEDQYSSNINYKRFADDLLKS